MVFLTNAMGYMFPLMLAQNDKIAMETFGMKFLDEVNKSKAHKLL